MAVLEDQKTDHAEKRQILESWELDALLLQTAEAENMGGGGRNDLPRVREALRALESKQ